VLVPVGGGAFNRLLDLSPGLEASTFHTVSKVLFRKHLELSPYFRSDGVLLEFKPATA
jgi:hypothetical protein